MFGHQSKNTVVSRVGLDIGSHTVKGVEIIDRGSEIVIRSAGSVVVPGARVKGQAPDAAATASAIKSLWSSAGFKSKNVVLALSPEAAYIKWLHLEASDEDELALTAHQAAVRGAPFPAHDAIVDYRVLLSRGSFSRNVHLTMLVAASSTAVDLLLNVVEGAGLEPEAVDIGSVAALRSFGAQKKATSPLWGGQPQAHCIIGARNTIITVVRGDELEFARTMPVGGNDLTECVASFTGSDWTTAEKLKTTPGTRLTEGGVMIASHDNEELRIPCENVLGRLAREINRSLRFFRSQFAEGSYLGNIGPATLSGGGALMKGLDSCIQEQGIEIAGIINPFAGYSVEAGGGGVQNVAGSAGAYTTAMGLAIGDYWSSYTATPLSVTA